MNHEQLRGEIAAIIAEITEVPVEQVTPDARLVHDLGADSMNALELLTAVERRFDVVIDPSRLVDFETPSKITTLVGELLQRRG